MSDVTFLFGLLKNNAINIQPSDTAGFKAACDAAISEHALLETTITSLQSTVAELESFVATISSAATELNGAKFGKSVAIPFDQSRL